MLGIDVSKATLACTQLDPLTRQTLWYGAVANTEAGLADLLRRIPADCPWVLEPTGRYSDLAVRVARTHGRTVLLAPPKHAKRFLASVQSRAKTDPLDSRGLGLFALSVPLRPFPEKSPAVEQLQQLLRARRGLSKAITLLEQQRQALPQAAEALTRALTALHQERDTLDQQVQELVADQSRFATVAELDRVHGIGPLTAATVAACLESKQFNHPDQFVAFIGLDIAVRQSGQRRGQIGLTREGDAELRRLFYLAALANVRCKHSPFKTLYQQHRAKGLSGTAAACAVARKLARVCWSLVKYQSRYDPERVTQQAKRPPSKPLQEKSSGSA